MSDERPSVSTHTPGPWVYAPETPHYANAPYTVWTSKGPFHGFVAVTCSPGMMPYDPPERQAADARLIAATPDLLHELRDAESEARNELIRLSVCGRGDGPAYANWSEKQRRWSAAIAKATGTSPNRQEPRR